jgi:hypothetical protein
MSTRESEREFELPLRERERLSSAEGKQGYAEDSLSPIY